jgi:phage shock protein E
MLLLLAAVLLGLTTVTACSGSTAAPTIDTTGATIIDVRTPSEYAEGHLDGAVNVDVQNQALFTAALTDLDPDAAYVVYCRSGNRSAAATAQMIDAGFTDVTDAGGLQAAADATGLEIVTD